MSEAKASGLDGVVVADTAISDVDGERGRLVIAGADVEQLALSCDFETAAARVLAAGEGNTRPLGPTTAADVRSALARARSAAWEVVPRLGDALEAPDGMDALRAALADPSVTELVFDLVQIELEHGSRMAEITYFVEDPAFSPVPVTFDELVVLAREP